MLKKTTFVFRETFTVWLLVLIILGSGIDIEASKSSRSRTNHKSSSSSKQANRDHVALSYGGVSHGNNRGTHHQQQIPQKHVPQQHSAPASAPAQAPSAPQLPDNKPIGWHVPQNGPVQQKTISDTHSGYPSQHGAPPPYSPHQQPAANYPGAPPPYSQNPPPYSGQNPVGQPPPYSQYPHPQGITLNLQNFSYFYTNFLFEKCLFAKTIGKRFSLYI